MTPEQQVAAVLREMAAEVFSDNDHGSVVSRTINRLDPQWLYNAVWNNPGVRDAIYAYPDMGVMSMALLFEAELLESVQ
jgi:hypothetical protein